MPRLPMCCLCFLVRIPIDGEEEKGAELPWPIAMWPSELHLKGKLPLVQGPFLGSPVGTPTYELSGWDPDTVFDDTEGSPRPWGWASCLRRGEDPMTVPASSKWEESILRDQTPEKDTGPMSPTPSSWSNSSHLGSSLAPDPRWPLPTACACLVGKVGKASEARRGSAPSGWGCGRQGRGWGRKGRRCSISASSSPGWGYVLCSNFWFPFPLLDRTECYWTTGLCDVAPHHCSPWTSQGWCPIASGLLSWEVVQCEHRSNLIHPRDVERWGSLTISSSPGQLDGNGLPALPLSWGGNVGDGIMSLTAKLGSVCGTSPTLAGTSHF